MGRSVPAARAVGAGVCVMGWLGSAAAERPSLPAPYERQLSWDQPVVCLAGADGKQWSVQCDWAAKLCLYHDGCFPGTSGKRCKPLQRVKSCSAPADHPHSYRQLIRGGVQFVPARAEAPPGWQRDEQGRVFQTEFDMNRRLWLGASYRPSYGPHDHYQVGRVAFETGLRAEWLTTDTRTRHRLHVLDGELTVHPLGARATLVRYDTSRESGRPLLRLTTFWPPERHDLYLNLGWFAEAGGIELRPRASDDETFLRFAAAGLTWDLWHSSDLSDYVRLRLGSAFDDLYLDRDDVAHRLAITPLARVESDVLFDAAGLHRLTVGTGVETPVVWLEDEEALPTVRVRFAGQAAYELVVVAINDQPLSLRLAVEGGYRDDLLPELTGWELSGGAGVRVNFWAPAPDVAAQRRIAQVRGR